jgi:hypothetical protein
MKYFLKENVALSEKNNMYSITHLRNVTWSHRIYSSHGSESARAVHHVHTAPSQVVELSRSQKCEAVKPEVTWPLPQRKGHTGAPGVLPLSSLN